MPPVEDLQMIKDLELTWHHDRVGDLDPEVAIPEAMAVASSSGRWSLPVIN